MSLSDKLIKPKIKKQFHCDHILYALIMGAQGVGKTTLINKFCQRVGDDLPTIGVDFQIKYMKKICPKA